MFYIGSTNAILSNTLTAVMRYFRDLSLTTVYIYINIYIILYTVYNNTTILLRYYYQNCAEQDSGLRPTKYVIWIISGGLSTDSIYYNISNLH